MWVQGAAAALGLWAEPAEALWLPSTHELDMDCSSIREDFLRRLGSFNKDTRLLQRFYHSVGASIIFFAPVCWCCPIGSNGANKQNKPKKTSYMVGMELDIVEVSGDERKAEGYHGQSLLSSIR